MDAQKVDTFIMANGSFFKNQNEVREKLINLDDSKWESIQNLKFKNPTVILVISLVLGSLGVDRFMLGKIGTGIVKFLTMGGFGIWALIDWFLVMGMTKESNMAKLQAAL